MSHLPLVGKKLVLIMFLFFRPWAMDATNPTSDFEAPKDPRAHAPKAHMNLTDNEILGE